MAGKPPTQEEIDFIKQAFEEVRQKHMPDVDEWKFANACDRLRQTVAAVYQLRESGHLKPEEMPS